MDPDKLEEGRMPVAKVCAEEKGQNPGEAAGTILIWTERTNLASKSSFLSAYIPLEAQLDELCHINLTKRSKTWNNHVSSLKQ